MRDCVSPLRSRKKRCSHGSVPDLGTLSCKRSNSVLAWKSHAGKHLVVTLQVINSKSPFFTTITRNEMRTSDKYKEHKRGYGHTVVKYASEKVLLRQDKKRWCIKKICRRSSTVATLRVYGVTTWDLFLPAYMYTGDTQRVNAANSRK